MKTAAQTPNVLTAKEVATLFRVNLRTIYRLVNKNEIPHFFVGDTIRFSKEKINEWMGQHKLTE